MNYINSLKLILSFVITFVITNSFSAFEASADCSTSGGTTCAGYDLCIPSYAIASNLKIRAQGDTCYQNCDQACQTSFSVQSAGKELNDDVISLCNLFCKNNIPFQGGKRTNNLKINSSVDAMTWTYVTPNDYTYFGPYDVTSAEYYMPIVNNASSWVNFNNAGCSSTNLYEPYNTNLDTRNGGTITITLNSPDAGTANEVILCGHDIRKLEPWYNRLYPDPSAHSTPFDSNWSGFPNPSWIYDNTGIIFSARDFAPADPLLFIKNGDWLKISYSGRIYSQWGSPDTTPVPDFIFRKPDNAGNSTNAHATSCAYTDCNWVSQDPNHYMYFLGRPDYSYNINNLNAQTYGFQRTSNLGQNAQITYNKGGGTTTNATIPYSEFIANPVQGLSESFFRLGIVSFDRINPPAWPNGINSGYYTDNYGGQYFNFQPKGCVYNNGHRLEYTITPAGNPPPANAVWTMVPNFVANKANIVSNQQGKVWLRIAKMATNERSGISCTVGQNETCLQQSGYYYLNDYQNQIYNNVSGQYYVDVEVNN